MFTSISASFKVKVILSMLLIACASLLTSSFTTYTYTASYRIKAAPLALPEEIPSNLAPNELQSQDLVIPALETPFPPSGESEAASNEPEPEIDYGNPYFKQPGDGDLLVHYDSRYFLGSFETPEDGIVSSEIRKATLHHMVRAYLKTMRRLKLETWIAHGTLLGWWWNGKTLPWDWDVDVQVADKTLWYMGEHLNGSTFTYEEQTDESQGIIAGVGKNGTRTYLLDVNPDMYQRIKGIGDNFIDARWIDTSNGLFIDITAISVTKAVQNASQGGDEETEQIDRTGQWQCKNEHWYNSTDIWPLRDTMFEGVIASVPGEYELVLYNEYGLGSMQETEFMGHIWRGKEGEWTPESEEEKNAREERERMKVAEEERARLENEERLRVEGDMQTNTEQAAGMEGVEQAQATGDIDNDEDELELEMTQEVSEESASWIHFLMGLR